MLMITRCKQYAPAAFLLCLTLTVLVSGCGPKRIPSSGTSAPTSKKVKQQKPYTIAGKTYRPLATAEGFTQTGLASWYGKDFHGRKTANGETYDMYGISAAHKILPFNTMVRVTNLDNGKRIDVRINDRGPFIRGRIIDLTYTAAKRIDMIGPGTARVRIETLNPVRGYNKGDLAGKFYIQTGAFTEKRNAREVANALRARGYRGTRLQQARVGGQTVWRVQAGAFTSLSGAGRAEKRLEKTYPGSFILAD
jgi:rare lipoprotein A